MKSEAARSDLSRAAAHARRGGVCLMCYERDHRRCHRDIVAANLAAETGVSLRHLEVRCDRSRSCGDGWPPA